MTGALDRPELGIETSDEINFGAVGEVEIYQNCKYVVLTEIFSVPLDREFGMDFTMVDKPPEIAKIMLEQECAMKISFYEPRAYFTEIDYYIDELLSQMNKMKPRVKVEILSTTNLELTPFFADIDLVTLLELLAGIRREQDEGPQVGFPELPEEPEPLWKRRRRRA